MRRGRLLTGSALLAAISIIGTACSSDGSASNPASVPTGSHQAVAGQADAGQVAAGQDPVPGDPPQTVTRADVDAAIDAWKPMIADALTDTGVPGIAVGVVHDDELVYAEGFGVRDVDTREPVDEQTVFQLASISKTISATVIAGLAGAGRVGWDDPIVGHLPGFALADPYVTEHVTIADMYSHRSGLPDHPGDDLEELGYDRQEIIERLRYQPLTPFRANYDYTNYGLTAGAEAAVADTGLTWEAAADQYLFEPAGMTSTVSTVQELLAAPNHATPHTVHADGTWGADFLQQPDPASPAAGVSSNIVDLARFLRLQIGAGTLDGRQIVEPNALTRTHLPQNIVGFPALLEQPVSPTGRVPQYGLGWFTGVTDTGHTRYGHCGAFSLGASTCLVVVPGQRLGVVVLTNGTPIGVPEALTEQFVDLALTGSADVDWTTIYRDAFASALHPEPDAALAEVSNPSPAAPDATYVGDYANPYFSDVSVRVGDDGLEMVMGPARRVFPLTHHDGDVFAYLPPGVLGVTEGPVTFTVEGDHAVTMHIGGFFDKTGQGTVRRVGA